MPKTEMYDAQGEYLKQNKIDAGPRNVPAHLMTKIRAASLNNLVSTGPAEDSAMLQGLTGHLLQWDAFTKMEKLEKIAMLSLGEVKALMSNEDDNEVLMILLGRKKEIEKQQKVG